MAVALTVVGLEVAAGAAPFNVPGKSAVFVNPVPDMVAAEESAADDAFAAS